MKCRSSKPTSSRNTAVRQQTRTVKVPTVLPWGRSNVNLKPHDLLPSSSHGSLPSTSAGWTTQIVSPVANRPTTGCNKQVFSRGLTIPNVPHTAAIWRRTFLRLWRGEDLVRYRHDNSHPWMRNQCMALTGTWSLEHPDAHRPLFADKQMLHHTYNLCALPVCVATYQAVQSTPTLYEWLSVNHRLTRTNSL